MENTRVPGPVSVLVPDELRPGVGAVVHNERGQVLLQRRRFEGRWAPPSGSVTPGEGVRAAIIREVYEETGLHVEIERLSGVYSEPPTQFVRRASGALVHFVTSVFVCSARNGTLVGDAEVLEQRWFDRFALPDDLLPYAELWLHDALRGGPAAVR